MKQHGVIFGYDRGYRYVDPGFEGTYWSTDILRTPLTKRLIVCVARWHWDGK